MTTQLDRFETGVITRICRGREVHAPKNAHSCRVARPALLTDANDQAIADRVGGIDAYVERSFSIQR